MAAWISQFLEATSAAMLDKRISATSARADP